MELQFNPQTKKFLAITAHPDDADFCSGGTLLKWVENGSKGAIVILTNGDKGSHDNALTPEQMATLRYKEQLEASKFMGLEHTWFLEYPDAHLECTQELKEKLVRIIRAYKPNVIFTWDPTEVYSIKRNMVNHPDHRAAGQAALDSLYPMARDFLTFPQHKAEGLEPHCVEDVFLFNFDKPNYYEDIGSTLERKLELLKKHESQIDSEKIEPVVKDLAKSNGEKIGVDYAESFLHLSFPKD